MAGNKTVLRTAHVGDVFRLDDKTEINHEGTEFPSKQAAADAIEVAANNGIQLYVVQPPEDAVYPEDQADRPVDGLDHVDLALIASGLAEDKPAKAPAQNQGGNG